RCGDRLATQTLAARLPSTPLLLLANPPILLRSPQHLHHIGGRIPIGPRLDLVLAAVVLQRAKRDAERLCERRARFAARVPLWGPPVLVLDGLRHLRNSSYDGV